MDNAHGLQALSRILQDICGETTAMPGVKVRQRAGRLWVNAWAGGWAGGGITINIT